MGKSKTSFDEISSTGEFKRTASVFREKVSRDGTTKYKPESGRYVLYISWACPWASRCMAVRALKGLESCIDFVAVEPRWKSLDATEKGEQLPDQQKSSAANNILSAEDHTYGWVFSKSEEDATTDSDVDKYNQCKTVRQLYEKACPDYSGKYTVPVLWDLKTSQIVNNESSEIVAMLDSEFDEFANFPEVSLRPSHMVQKIDEINEWMYNAINNGVYRCGFARSQEAYDKAFKELFDTLDEAEEILAKSRYIAGNYFTESDIRLFCTLIRFDAVYYVHFKCNLKKIEEYPNLSNWLRDIYQTSSMSSTVKMDQIKQHYYGSHPSINPFLIIPNGPEINFATSHNRDSQFPSSNPWAWWISTVNECGMASIIEQPVKVMSLEELRSTLIRLEETIIFALIERAQFKTNPDVYQPGALGNQRFTCSFLDYILAETEKVHALVRRYVCPEEHAFFPEQLPSPILPLDNRYPYYLKPNSINYNQRIKSLYETEIIPRICETGDDKNYGSAATCDIHVLQALSKRVHYGKYVAEVKYQTEKEKFETAITNKDSDALMKFITNEQVEKRLLERIFVKASTYGQDIGSSEASERQYKVSPQVIVDLYEKFLIPITKDIEVDYLLQRMQSSVDIAFLGPTGTFSHAAAASFFGGVKEIAYLPNESIPHVFESVLSNKVNYGIVPYSNSFAGIVPATNEQLHHTSAHVCGEVSIPIAIHLVGKPGTKLSEIRRVFSHPHAIAQSRNWMKEHLLSDVKISETTSTAEGVRIVNSLESNDSAALASKHAAELYGMEILSTNAQDSPHSHTRFLVIAKQFPKSSCGSDHSFIRFTLLNTAGKLSSALATFAKHCINLYHIESKQIVSNQQEGVQFLLECEGHASDQSVADAIKTLNEFAVDVHVIGSFPHIGQ